MRAIWKGAISFGLVYEEVLEKLTEKNVAHGVDDLPSQEEAKQPTRVVDLVSVLQPSTCESQNRHDGNLSRRDNAPPHRKLQPHLN